MRRREGEERRLRWWHMADGLHILRKNNSENDFVL
jgi:hypothetical protein